MKTDKTMARESFLAHAINDDLDAALDQVRLCAMMREGAERILSIWFVWFFWLIWFLWFISFLLFKERNQPDRLNCLTSPACALRPLGSRQAVRQPFLSEL